MKVLVTGGGGFIGSHLARTLIRQGHDTAILGRRLDARSLPEELRDGATLISGDARDDATMIDAAQNCSAIFHCAAMVGAETYAEYPVETMDTEVDSLRAACRAALHASDCKVIYPSTSAVYGDVGAEGQIDEAAPLAPTSSYAVAKRFNELYLAAQYREHELQSVSLRIFNIYGPGQDRRLVIPRFIGLALAEDPLTIYGDGHQVRDFTYVEDVVEAMVRCAHHVDGCEILNVCSGSGFSVRDMAELVVQFTNTNSEIRFAELPAGRRDFEVSRCVGSSDKLERLVNFAPVTPFEQGLQQTVEYMKERMSFQRQ